MKVSEVRITIKPTETKKMLVAALGSSRNWAKSRRRATGQFTTVLMGLSQVPPADPTSASLSQPAERESTLVVSSKGSNTATASRLKKSCTVAVAKARSNSLVWRTWPRETKVLVRVVPMLAPMIMGTAASRLTAPEATRPTMIDVLALEDCTITVAKIPTNRPARGLETVEKSASWASAPRILIPVSSEATPDRNAVMRAKTTSARTRGVNHG